jgi:hypothetical protein
VLQKRLPRGALLLLAAEALKKASSTREGATTWREGASGEREVGVEGMAGRCGAQMDELEQAGA